MRLAVLGLFTAPWSIWRPATCLPSNCFCEAVGDGLIRQPANTWSSFAFVLVGVWVLSRLRGTRGPGVRPWTQADTTLFVGSLLAIGFGSAFYHASLSFVGQVVDVSGMYFMATFILLHRLGPRWKLRPPTTVALFVTINAGLMLAQVALPSLRRVAFAVLLISALVVEWKASRSGRIWLIRSAATMAVAFAIWTVDLLRWTCAPDSLLQGHAVWHLLGAAAAALLYRSYEGARADSTTLRAVS
ncbi:MAG: ceramidase domain-containing protein [Vicinamibacteria bacterium]